jgi:hypothetical protein
MSAVRLPGVKPRFGRRPRFADRRRRSALVAMDCRKARKRAITISTARFDIIIQVARVAFTHTLDIEADCRPSGRGTVGPLGSGR